MPKNEKTYKDAPTGRHNLPSRRLTETRKVKTGNGQKIFLSVGYDPNDQSRPREVFYSAGFRSGSELEFQVQDLCVMISLLLQHGHMPADIAKSLARREMPDGQIQYASIAGVLPSCWLQIVRD